MNSKWISVFSGITLMLLMSGFAYAADYRSMTTEELRALRGTMYNATEAERNAFRNEWRNRVQQMTAEERKAYNASSPGKGTGVCDGCGLGVGDGRGGSGGGGNGSGNGSGGGGNGSGNGGGGGKGRQ